MKSTLSGVGESGTFPFALWSFVYSYSVLRSLAKNLVEASWGYFQHFFLFCQRSALAQDINQRSEFPRPITVFMNLLACEIVTSNFELWIWPLIYFKKWRGHTRERSSTPKKGPILDQTLVTVKVYLLYQSESF